MKINFLNVSVVMKLPLFKYYAILYESESEVAQLCPILWDPMDGSLPGSSVHGIFQARVLEWVAISISSLCFNVSVYEVIWSRRDGTIQFIKFIL